MVRLVQEHEWIQSLLRPLATIADAPVDSLVRVLMALHGGLGEAPEGCHVRGILEIAAKYKPGQIRVLPARVNLTSVWHHLERAGAERGKMEDSRKRNYALGIVRNEGSDEEE